MGNAVDQGESEQTTLMFVDTSTFFTCLFNVRSSPLARILRLIQAGTHSLIQTSITEREIRKHLAARGEEIEQAWQKRAASWNASLQKHGLNTEEHGVMEKILGHKLRKEFVTQFETFWKQAAPLVLPTTSIEFEEMYVLYDRARPPFSAIAEGKRRREFPDVAAFLTLKEYANEKQVGISIVADDPDWKAMCAGSSWANYEAEIPQDTLELVVLERCKTWLKGLDGAGKELVSLAVRGATLADEYSNFEPWELIGAENIAYDADRLHVAHIFAARANPAAILKLPVSATCTMRVTNYMGDHDEYAETVELEEIGLEGEVTIQMSWDPPGLPVDATPTLDSCILGTYDKMIEAFVYGIDESEMYDWDAE